MKLLILGGTTEAAALARALAGDARFDATLSLAGRTRAPAAQALPTRVGGFGGVEGLSRFLVEQRVDAVIDATHPFAANMTRNAVTATDETGTPLLILCRPAWTPGAEDRWQVVASMRDAAAALGTAPRRVFVTVGRQDVAPFCDFPWHHYLLRSIDPPPPELLPPDAEFLSARGPFAEADELRLLTERRIEVIVTKNSGGSATEAKLAAARTLSLPVVMVARPPAPDRETVATVPEALDWLTARHGATERGV